MNTAGWWANTTTRARNIRCTATTAAGTGGVSAFCLAAMCPSCLRNKSVAQAALMSTAMAAFQPKLAIMNQVSQFHLAATISTGGAAKGVSVPPMEMFTNRVPSVAYLSLVEMSREYKVSRSIRAARVMAAGSVMNDPSKGTNASTRKYSAMPGGKGM